MGHYPPNNYPPVNGLDLVMSPYLVLHGNAVDLPVRGLIQLLTLALELELCILPSPSLRRPCVSSTWLKSPKVGKLILLKPKTLKP